MRSKFIEYINEKTSKKEFEESLKNTNLLGGCEFEIYIDELDQGANFNNDYIEEMKDKREDEIEDRMVKEEEYDLALKNLEDSDKPSDDEAVNSLNYDYPFITDFPSFKKLYEYLVDIYGFSKKNDKTFNDILLKMHKNKIFDRGIEVTSFFYKLTSISLENILDGVFSNKTVEVSVDDIEKIEPKFPFNINDFEVKPDETLGVGGVEIITGVIPLPELINVIEKIFDWIDNIGHTNYDTGFHVHMSNKDRSVKIDTLKLLLFTEEGKIYQENWFNNRMYNEYAENIFKGHLDDMIIFTPKNIKKSSHRS